MWYKMTSIFMVTTVNGSYPSNHIDQLNGVWDNLSLTLWIIPPSFFYSKYVMKVCTAAWNRILFLLLVIYNARKKNNSFNTQQNID